MHTLRLPVKLTEEERLSRGQRAGELGYDLTQVEEREKETKAAFKAQKERLQGEINDLLNQLRSGKEWREVPVSIDKDLKQRLEVTTRLDTGEVVSTRPLGAEEMQGELTLAPTQEIKPATSNIVVDEEELPAVANIEDAKKMDDDELFELASGFALKQDDPTVVTVERLQFEFKIGQTKAKRLLKRLKDEDLLSYPSNPTNEETPSEETKKEDTSDEWWK